MLEPHRPVAQLGKRETQRALALVPGIVDDHEPPLAVLSVPGAGDEAVRRPVAVPGRRAFEQLPLPIAYDRLPEHRQETAVELLQRCGGRLHRRANEVRRYALPA